MSRLAQLIVKKKGTKLYPIMSLLKQLMTAVVVLFFKKESYLLHDTLSSWEASDEVVLWILEICLCNIIY